MIIPSASALVQDRLNMPATLFLSSGHDILDPLFKNSSISPAPVLAPDPLAPAPVQAPAPALGHNNEGQVKTFPLEDNLRHAAPQSNLESDYTFTQLLLM